MKFFIISNCTKKKAECWQSDPPRQPTGTISYIAIIHITGMAVMLAFVELVFPFKRCLVRCSPDNCLGLSVTSFCKQTKLATTP